MKSNIRTVQKCGGSLQITIPKKVVEELQLTEGDKLEFSINGITRQIVIRKDFDE